MKDIHQIYLECIFRIMLINHLEMGEYILWGHQASRELIDKIAIIASGTYPYRIRRFR